MFRLPDLPGPWYKKMQEIRHFHKLTQWQFFVLAIKVVCRVGQENPHLVELIAAEVQQEHPGQYKHVDESSTSS